MEFYNPKPKERTALATLFKEIAAPHARAGSLCHLLNIIQHFSIKWVWFANICAARSKFALFSSLFAILLAQSLLKKSCSGGRAGLSCMCHFVFEKLWNNARERDLHRRHLFRSSTLLQLYSNLSDVWQTHPTVLGTCSKSEPGTAFHTLSNLSDLDTWLFFKILLLTGSTI